MIIPLTFDVPEPVSTYFRSLEDTLADVAAAIKFQHGALISQTRFLKRTVIRQKDTLDQAKANLDEANHQKQELARLREENAQLRRALAENSRPVEGSAKRKQRISPGSQSSTGSRVPARLSLPPPERKSPTLRDQFQQYSYVPASPSRPAAPSYSPSLSETQMPPPARPPIRRVFRDDPNTTPLMPAAPMPRQPTPRLNGPAIGTPRSNGPAGRSIAPNAIRPMDYPRSSVLQQRSGTSLANAQPGVVQQGQRVFRPDLGSSGPRPFRPRQ